MDPARLPSPLCEYPPGHLKRPEAHSHSPFRLSESESEKNKVFSGRFFVERYEPQTTYSLNPQPVARFHSPTSAFTSPFSTQLPSYPRLPQFPAYNLYNSPLGRFSSAYQCLEKNLIENNNASRSPTIPLSHNDSPQMARLQDTESCSLAKTTATTTSSTNTVSGHSVHKAFRERRSRCNLDPAQKRCLESMYQNKKYPEPFEKEQIAESLDLSEKQVSVWFSNRRARDKKNNAFAIAELNVSDTKDGIKGSHSPQTTADTTDTKQTYTTYTLVKDRNVKVMTVSATTDLMAIQLMQEKLQPSSRPDSL